jgi:hypothetical protein
MRAREGEEEGEAAAASAAAAAAAAQGAHVRTLGSFFALAGAFFAFFLVPAMARSSLGGHPVARRRERPRVQRMRLACGRSRRSALRDNARL